MPERKTLNEDLFYRGSSANLPRLHTCENKVPLWDFSQFAVTKGLKLGVSSTSKLVMLHSNEPTGVKIVPGKAKLVP